MPDPVTPTGAMRPADPRTNTVVKWVLRTGLSVSLLLLIAGLVIQLTSGADTAEQVRMFAVLSPRPLGEKLMSVGALVLTLTPAAGVLSVLVSWMRERDGRYIGVGVAVVLVLTAAVVAGRG